MHKTPYVYATIPRLQASPTKILRGVLQYNFKLFNYF